MAYKITRTQKITETLELSDKNGNVIGSIDIDIDADAVCTAFRKKQTEVIDAERRLKEIRKTVLKQILNALMKRMEMR